MIQSDKFDSAKMNIKKITDIALIFAIKRFIEIFGIFILCTGILLFISLITYSPDDPNFIFPENSQIENLLGFQGSYISDLLFQSIGLIAYLVSITFIFTGINIFRNKDIFLIIENIFYTILYSILGSLFFTFFYKNAFTLYINGNGGFVGNYFNQTFLNKLILFNENISFYVFIILIISLFFISINLSPKNFYYFIKRIINFFNKKDKNYTNKNEIINEYIPQDEIKNLIQEDLPFIRAEEMKKSEKSKFVLPNLELLKVPSKKERESSEKNLTHDPDFLEKILLDFGVNGNIKKI